MLSSVRNARNFLLMSPWAFSANFVKVSNIGLIDVGGHGEREQRVTFRFRFLSAKPVKMAFAQLEMLQKPEDRGLADRMNAIVNSELGRLRDLPEPSGGALKSVQSVRAIRIPRRAPA